MAEGLLATMNGSPIPLDLQELHDLESRSRSGTWPLSEGEDIQHDQSDSPMPNNMGGVHNVSKQSGDTKRMRNAWGNLSYADLITQAILSSAEKRLTLAEIYEWIVQNISYFSDKASSPSTAGWKVSVCVCVLCSVYCVVCVCVYCVVCIMIGLFIRAVAHYRLEVSKFVLCGGPVSPNNNIH